MYMIVSHDEQQAGNQVWSKVVLKKKFKKIKINKTLKGLYLEIFLFLFLFFLFGW